MIRLRETISSLSSCHVDYVIVGGIAIKMHSSSYFTVDLDFCYHRSPDNLKKLVSALSPFNPRPRDFPAGLPFVFDESTLNNGTNFTFETDLGDIDFLGEVAGIGDYKAVIADSIPFALFGYKVNVLTVSGLIKAKRAAGRTKDLMVLPELEALLELQTEDED